MTHKRGGWNEHYNPGQTVELDKVLYLAFFRRSGRGDTTVRLLLSCTTLSCGTAQLWESGSLGIIRKRVGKDVQHTVGGSTKTLYGANWNSK